MQITFFRPMLFKKKVTFPATVIMLVRSIEPVQPAVYENQATTGTRRRRGCVLSRKVGDAAVVPIGIPGSDGILPSTANSRGSGAVISNTISDVEEAIGPRCGY